MLRSELNSVFIQTLLYYVNQQISGRRYQMWGQDLGSWGYNDDGDLIIINWLPLDITQPDINTLLTYDINDVNIFYKYNYQLPNDINSSQVYLKISSVDLALIPTSLNIHGYRVYDTTIQQVVQWDGTNWINS